MPGLIRSSAGMRVNKTKSMPSGAYILSGRTGYKQSKLTHCQGMTTI